MSLHEEPSLPVTLTHSGRAEKGTILGLEGKAVVPVLASTVLSVCGSALAMLGDPGSVVPLALMSWLPTAITIWWVVALVHHKPPHYARDYLEALLVKVPGIGKTLSRTGLAFHASPEAKDYKRRRLHVGIDAGRLSRPKPNLLRRLFG